MTIHIMSLSNLGSVEQQIYANKEVVILVFFQNEEIFMKLDELDRITHA